MQPMTRQESRKGWMIQPMERKSPWERKSSTRMGTPRKNQTYSPTRRRARALPYTCSTAMGTPSTSPMPSARATEPTVTSVPPMMKGKASTMVSPTMGRRTTARQSQACMRISRRKSRITLKGKISDMGKTGCMDMANRRARAAVHRKKRHGPLYQSVRAYLLRYLACSSFQ